MVITETQRVNEIIKNNSITEKQFYELEIARWKKSDARKAMITGEKYYSGTHDILNRKREVLGEDGTLVEVENLPNNKIVDNQYAKMVDQKVNYLLGKPMTVKAEDESYSKQLNEVFNKAFYRKLKNICEDSLNGGIGWLYPYYNEQGELAFKRFKPYEILPFWKDAEHTELEAAVRLYEIEAYEGKNLKAIEKVEIYTLNGIKRYELKNNALIEDKENPKSDYVQLIDEDGKSKGYNWERIPLIPFKYNNKETPLISRVKALQDGINNMLSDFENNMQEDARNTILVLKNYDGTNLGEFRRNLATYGVVKVRTIDGADGAVETLTIKVNADNYKAILELFKKALIENARGYDAKDDRLAGNPNQMNIQSMYSDIDLDANGMETEFQAALEELMWFVNTYISNTGETQNDSDVEFIFNRDVLINESEAITNCSSSAGVISDETIIANHPWVTNVDEELKRKKAETQGNEYQNAFQHAAEPVTGDEE